MLRSIRCRSVCEGSDGGGGAAIGQVRLGFSRQFA